MTVSEWADEHRRLSQVSSAEPGKWRTERAPYQRAIMDAISDPSVERVVAMLSSQVGKTEAILNAIGYFVDQDPCAMLVVMPTLTMAEKWSQDRLSAMLRDTPILAGAVQDPRSRQSGNTVLHKTFHQGRGQITIAGANSPASLASQPIRVLLCDEVDRYPPSAGTEGDPIVLAAKRTTTFWNRKLVEVSSPTIAGRSRIHESYEQSDMRRYYVPCHACGEFQTLTFGQVRWDSAQPTVAGKAATARYHCIACNEPWTDTQRRAAVARGVWRAEKPFAGIAGFHLNELASPWRTIAQTVTDFLHCEGDQERLKAFINTSLAELWSEQGEVPDWERLVERREPFPLRVVPEGACVLTAGIDNQDNRIEAYVWAWKAGFTSWLIDHRVFMGSPASDTVWSELAEWLDGDYPHADGGPPMRIAQIGMDVMGHHTAAVYQQLRKLRDPRVLALRGADGRAYPAMVTGPKLIDTTHNGQRLRGGMKIWTVATSMTKSDLYSRLWLTRGDGVDFPPGWVHLPDGIDAEAVKQLVAERLVKVKSRAGYTKTSWEKLRDRNEALDCAVYARAALHVLGADRKGSKFWERWARNPEDFGAVLPGEAAVTAAAAPAAPSPPPPPPPPSRPVGRSSYLSRLGR